MGTIGNNLGNYLANNYVDSNNKDINKCIASAIKNEKECNLEPVDTYLDVNEKMFKQISVYKKSHEKLKEIMNKLHTCPLVTNVQNETYKDAFSKLSVPGSEIRFITTLLKYIDTVNRQFENYKKDIEVCKKKYVSLKKATYKGPYMNGGIFKSPDEKYLLGLMIIPLKEEDKDKYHPITRGPDIKKQSGIVYSSARKGDIIYGIGFKGKDFTMEDGIPVDNQWTDKMIPKFFPYEGQEDLPEIKVEAKSKADSFIDLPKKRNGLMYVIFFILLLVLVCKLKK
tara:strand:+ start:4706 stop:5554 length:849 start_codon:yes stop_codon:yes gene_type:complete